MDGESAMIYAMMLCPAAFGLGATALAVWAFHASAQPDAKSKVAMIVVGVVASVFALGIGGCYAMMFLDSGFH